MKKFLLILLLISTIRISSQTYVLIPDANFVTFLQGLVPTAMNSNSLDITNTLVTTSNQTINASFHNISNLNGIQYFTSLNRLNCSGNSLTSLSSLTNSLQYLDCSNNPLTNLTGLPNTIQYLFCSSASLTSISSLPNSLTELFCQSNSLTSLPTLPSSLQMLECTANSLTTLPALPNSLTYLNCSFNQLSSLPVLPNSLNYFDCQSNNITCFPVFPNSIATIHLNNNPYTCFPNFIPAMSNYTSTPLCAAGNPNGCPIASTTGIKENSLIKYAISIYPNPTLFDLHIQGLEIESIERISITDDLGNMVLEKNENVSKISVQNLPRGIYLLRVSSDGIIYSTRFIKE